MARMSYDKFGISRKINPETAGMTASELSWFNSDSNGTKLEKIGVVAIIEALQEFGGITKASLLKEKASESPYFTDEERENVFDSGKSSLNFHLQFAMSNLKRAGLLFSPKRGYWELTDLGNEVDLDHFDVWDDVYSISLPVWEEAKNSKKADAVADNVMTDEERITDVDDSEIWRQELLKKLQQMDPYKFEELIVNLMRKIGIKMETTAKSGDSGIDGIGYLRTPELMTYKIVLQTKRYATGQVTGPDISNFAGTISGHNADRGIFVTTSSYTKDAVSRSRQGANLITLVDGEELVDLLFEHQMGVSEKTIVVIDDRLFGV